MPVARGVRRLSSVQQVNDGIARARRRQVGNVVARPAR